MEGPITQNVLCITLSLASCLINAQPLPAHHFAADNNEMGCCQVVVWVRSFIEPDLFDNNVPFDSTTPSYLINLLWKLWLGLGLDLQLHYFFAENNENEHFIFC